VEGGTKVNYDILFTASTYRSSANAIRFVRSIKHIKGDHICILVTPLQSDATEIVNLLRNTKNLGCRVLIFLSDVDNLYQGRGWGFVWAVANGIHPTYLCSCDDDLEFTENSHDIVNRLDANNFSVMTFKANINVNAPPKVRVEEDKTSKDIIWLNGDSMFTHFEDNLAYGVADALLEYPVSFFVEIEYQQRMCHFTSEWLTVDREREFYLHHFREDNELTRLRSQHAAVGITTGKRLWKEKYGIELPDMHPDVAGLYPKVCAMPAKMKSHFIFYGMWNEWDKIYERLEPQFHFAYDTGDPRWD
jgi:hypothetical protein